jgi:hypothetical protein
MNILSKASRIAAVPAFLILGLGGVSYGDVMDMDRVSTDKPARIEPGYPDSKDKVVVSDAEEDTAKPFVFNEKEFSADVFALYATEASDGAYGDGFGPGIGINYFFTRNFGLGLEGYGWNGDGFITAAALDLIYRYPIDEFRLAPYAIGTVGGNFGADDAPDQVNGGGGLGLEYRFVEHWSVFTDARYIATWQTNDYVLARAGVRFSF